MSELQANGEWSVVPLSRKYRQEMEVRRMYWAYSDEHIQRETEWFERHTYSRAKLQSYVERVLRVPLKVRKSVYKEWRAELGDDVARTYAKFAEHLIKEGRTPKWFLPEITHNPYLKLLPPSSKSESSPEIFNNSPQEQQKTIQQTLL